MMSGMVRSMVSPVNRALGPKTLDLHPVYCAVVLDVYSRRVVDWSIDSTKTGNQDDSTEVGAHRSLYQSRGGSDPGLEYQ